MVNWVVRCSHVTTFSLLCCMADADTSNRSTGMVPSRYGFHRFRDSGNRGWRIIDDDDFLGKAIFVEIVPIRLSGTLSLLRDGFRGRLGYRHGWILVFVFRNG